MKKTLTAIFLVATILLPVLAQEPARDVDTVLTDQRIKRMTTVLTLTDDQKTKARPLILEEIKAFKSYRADTSLTEEDRIVKEKAYREAARPKFKAILTEEQFAKYEEMQKDKSPKKPAK